MVGSGRSHNYHISNFSLEGRWVSVQYLFDEYISLSLFLIMKNYDKNGRERIILESHITTTIMLS